MKKKLNYFSWLNHSLNRNKSIFFNRVLIKVEFSKSSVALMQQVLRGFHRYCCIQADVFDETLC